MSDELPTLTAEQFTLTVESAAAALAQDPEARHYSPETVALVLSSTVRAVDGTRTLGAACDRIAADPALFGVDEDVIVHLSLLTMRHWGRALATVFEGSEVAS